MKEAPLPSIITPKEKLSESFELKQDEKNYLLNIEIINQDIILNLVDLNEFMKEYEFKLAFNELKELNKVFSMLSSCQEFLDYMKALISNKKLLIKNTAENQMSIEFIAEYLLKNAPKKVLNTDGYITITGNTNIRNKIRQMINETKLRLYILAPSVIIRDFETELNQLIKMDMEGSVG